MKQKEHETEGRIKASELINLEMANKNDISMSDYVQEAAERSLS